MMGGVVGIVGSGSLGTRWRAVLAGASTLLLMALLAAPGLAAQEQEALPKRGEGVHVWDDARVINGVDEQDLQAQLQALQEDSDVDIVVVTQQKQPVGSRVTARADAARVLEEWQVGGDDGRGAVMLWNINPQGRTARSGVALGVGFEELDARAVDNAVNTAAQPGLDNQDWKSALVAGRMELETRLSAAASATARPRTSTGPGATSAPRRPTGSGGRRPTSGLSPAAGPPFPDDMEGLRVYDYAEVISPAVIEQLGDAIAAIEERTGAQVVVYTQVKPDAADDAAGTEQDAIALIDQWGIGRAGFDDGLAIFFDLRDNLCNGQVQLYAGPGFAAAFLSNEERQAIFEESMLPLLRDCDFDGALDRRPWPASMRGHG